MKIINGEKHFTAKEVGMLVNRTHLTVHLWDTWSNELEARGDSRLIPEPLKLGKQKTRYWNESDIEEIQTFAKNIQRGDLAEFSQRQWSKKDKVDKELETKVDNYTVSDRKFVKTVQVKNTLSFEDKLIFAVIYFLAKEGQVVTIDEIQKHVTLVKSKIEESLKQLIEQNYIINKDNIYLLMK